MNCFKMQGGTTGYDADPEIPMEFFEDLSDARNHKRFPPFPKHVIIFQISFFSSVFREIRGAAEGNQNIRKTLPPDETDLSEFLFREIDAEVLEHQPVCLKKNAFRIDEHSIVVKEDGIQHKEPSRSRIPAFPVNSFLYSRGDVRYFSRKRREK